MSESFARSIRRHVQLIDQSLGRAERSEVLTDEVVALEKMTESIRQALRDVIKPLQMCLLPAAEPEKRLRKIPESAFAEVLFASAGTLSDSAVFATVFGRLSESQKSLAEALIQYTLNVEKKVIEPLNVVVDTEIPSITKLRKDLTKATLDMDAAKKACASLEKQDQVPTGKLDAARQNLATEEAKVVKYRDLLLIGLYQFSSREKKLCNLLLSILQFQVDYHKRSIMALDHQISELTKEIDQNTVKPVYGCDLEEHLNDTGKEIATVIEVCVQTIEQKGLDTEGLFRVSSSQGKLRKLKAAFDANIEDAANGEDIDVHCLADALKHYLRELPEPLMTFELYDEWCSTTQSSENDRRKAMRAILKKLPKANYDNLKYLIQFMAKITEHSKTNKMSAMNLAIVMAPNILISSRTDSGGVDGSGTALAVVETLISDASRVFADEQPEPVVVSIASQESPEDDRGSTAEDGRAAGGGGTWNRIGNFFRSLRPTQHRRRSPRREQRETRAENEERRP